MQTMRNEPMASTPSSADVGRDSAKTTLAIGGLLASFGVASCCALPIALSFLGIGAASLAGIGVLAAPYQRELFLLAVVFLGATGVVSWRQQRVRACMPGSACTRPVVNWITWSAAVVAVALLALAWWIESPL